MARKSKSSSGKMFISYVRENRAAIDSIYEAFKAKGIECWLDRKDIEPGENWKNAIRKAIENGACFIACFSIESENKVKSYMREEIILAVEMLRQRPVNSKWFISIKLSNCAIPHYEIGAGQLLSDLHVLDMYEDFQLGLERLTDVVINRVKIKKQRKMLPADELEYKKYRKLELEYVAYKALIDSGEGRYFHNKDMGHPVYVAGATGSASWDYADGPDRNRIFKNLRRVSLALKNNGIEDLHYIWWYDFSTWQKFCLYVVNTYRRINGYKELKGPAQ